MGAGGLASEADAVMGLTWCGCGCDGWRLRVLRVTDGTPLEDPSRLPCDHILHPEVFGTRCQSATGNRVLFQNKSLRILISPLISDLKYSSLVDNAIRVDCGEPTILDGRREVARCATRRRASRAAAGAPVL